MMYVNLRTRLYLTAAIILLLGFCSAIVIYLTAENDTDSILVYENSKKYMHDLELYGGKANVLANEFMHWFIGLWQGESLAYTVACITIFVSFGVFFVARHLPADLKSGDQDDDNRAGTD